MDQGVLLMDATAMQRAIVRIAHEIIERNKGTEQLALVGVLTRGVPLSMRIAQCIENIEGKLPQIGQLDIRMYRDDIDRNRPEAIFAGSKLPFDVTGKTIVMVDDVLFTGRTARAGMDAIMDSGRPGQIQLAVMVDRGHRQLPIKADYVGKNVPTSLRELIEVRVVEEDGVDEVLLKGTVA